MATVSGIPTTRPAQPRARLTGQGRGQAGRQLMVRTRPKSTWRRATRNTLVADDMREIMAWLGSACAEFVHHPDAYLTW
jgi:hypothetical protein